MNVFSPYSSWMMGDCILYLHLCCMHSMSWIVNNMFYPGTLKNNCCNSNVEIVDNLSYHVSWYVPDLPSYVVLQICWGLGIVVIDPFLEVPQEEVVTWIQVRGVALPREVGTTRNESITRKIRVKEFQRSVSTMGWCSLFSPGMNFVRISAI